MSDSLCVLPWMHLSVDGMGYFYNCCFGPGAQNPSCDENGKKLNAGDPDSIAKHWHSNVMKEIRLSMQKGEKHRSCEGCWRIEETGTKSFRHIANFEYPVDDETLASLVPPPVFRYVDLRFGNICNLACRMCIPYNSRKLFDEYTQMYGTDSVDPYRKMEWFKSPDFWEQLHKYRHNFEKIHLAGGEPLLIKECWKFLREMADDDCAKKITLSYNTNLTQIPPEAKATWSKYEGVVLLVSMDAIGKVNEFIRYPQQWSEFEKNLWEIENNFSDYNIKVCQIQPTIQAYNIHRIVEMCEFIAQFKNIKRVPNINLLFYPEHFSTNVLPLAYRQEAVVKLEDYIVKIEAGWNNLEPFDKNELLTALKGVITLLQGEDKTHLFQEFIRHNDVYDVHRNQKILEYIPELEPTYRK